MTASQYEFAVIYPNLNRDEQIRFLLTAIYQISLEGRGTYIAGGHGLTDPERLRLINEALHRISDHGHALMRDARPRRSDADVVAMLLGIADNLQLGHGFFDELLKKVIDPFFTEDAL